MNKEQAALKSALPIKYEDSAQGLGRTTCFACCRQTGEREIEFCLEVAELLSCGREFCAELGDVSISAVSCAGHGDGDPRLCFLKVTSARDGEGSRAAPWLSGGLDTICSASSVHW